MEVQVSFHGWLHSKHIASIGLLSQKNKTIATTEESKDRGSLLDSGSVMTKGTWQNIPSLGLAGSLWSLSGSPREAGYSNTPSQELQQQLCAWVSRLPCTLPGWFSSVSWPCDKHNRKCNSYLELWRLSSKLPFGRRVGHPRSSGDYCVLNSIRLILGRDQWEKKINSFRCL